MARGTASCDGRRVVRFAAVLAAVAAFAALPAQAADQVVSGMVEPTLGVSLDASGTGSGTSLATVTREQRGDVLVITVTPR